jgi:phage terminase small subunit
MTDRALTVKQQRFVDHVCNPDCPDATTAARRAGYAKKYADRQAWQLLEIPRVQVAIEAERDRVKAMVSMSEEEIISTLTELARGSEGAASRLKALDLLMKSKGMLKDVQHQHVSYDHAAAAERINNAIEAARTGDVIVPLHKVA